MNSKNIIENLKPSHLDIIKFIAFFNAPVSIELLKYAFPTDSYIDQSIERLAGELIITPFGSFYSLSSILQKTTIEMITDDEMIRYSTIINDHFGAKSRQLILGDNLEPSYGEVYLEAHPDYISDETGHDNFVRSLIDRMHENDIELLRGSNILVLGAGHGTHDLAFACHGFNIFNIEILNQAVKAGVERAKGNNIEVQYLISDITKPIGIMSNSMDAVFNIGTSFGFEIDDSRNLMIFENAARILKPKKCFVFECANGSYWLKKVKDKSTKTQLPGGLTRENHKIYDPNHNNSLDIITLQRSDGSKSTLFHFMHYYSLSDVKAMMSKAGLKVIKAYGGPEGASFNLTKSRSMVILAYKI